MIKDGTIIIPCVNLGNLIIMPQPTRGFGEDPEKLYHNPKIYPHHQYIAFYLWLKKKFMADAIVSLGKHGTHEWLPGKQIGLSMTDPPDVLIQDIPNIYPYIVDNIGEEIQAKRRGRGVIIDHLIPDSYAQLIKLMDKAVYIAGDIKDIENFVAINNAKIEKELLNKGYSEKEAKSLSSARVFAPMPGAYVHALQELIPNSGMWEEDNEISDVFIHHYSYAYGNTIWVKSLKSGYKSNLKDVKVTLAKATGKTPDEQKKDSQAVRQNLTKTIEEIRKEEFVSATDQGKNMKGFEMVEENLEKTKVTSSGSAWQVMVIVAGIITLLYAGYRRKV